MFRQTEMRASVEQCEDTRRAHALGWRLPLPRYCERLRTTLFLDALLRHDGAHALLVGRTHCERARTATSAVAQRAVPAASARDYLAPTLTALVSSHPAFGRHRAASPQRG